MGCTRERLSIELLVSTLGSIHSEKSGRTPRSRCGDEEGLVVYSRLVDVADRSPHFRVFRPLFYDVILSISAVRIGGTPKDIVPPRTLV